jgi:predicted trehalose synthase
MQMAGGLEVNSTALRQYAELIREQASRLEQVHSTLAGVSSPGGAFGKLPESADMQSAYAQHASAEVSNTAKLPGLLNQVAQGLDACASNYAAAESANTRAAQSVSGEMG